MISMDLKSILFLCSTVWIAGCATSSSAPITLHTSAVNDDASIKLAEAATSISQSLSNLEAMETATRPAALTKPLPSPDTYGMSDLVSVDWSGPVAPLLLKVGSASNYKVRVLGKEPAIPIIVSIAVKNTPLAYVLRDADFQCGDRANIIVYPAIRTIEIRYASA